MTSYTADIDVLPIIAFNLVQNKTNLRYNCQLYWQHYMISIKMKVIIDIACPAASRRVHAGIVMIMKVDDDFCNHCDESCSYVFQLDRPLNEEISEILIW